MSAHLASTLTWPKVKALAEAGAVALLPVGSTEAHGPHLPLSVDVVIAEEVCRRTAARLAAGGLPTVTFPAVAYGLTDFAGPFAGTVSLSAQVTSGLLEGVLADIARHGFTRVLAVNHHLEPAHFRVVKDAAARAAQATGAHIAAADHRKPPFGERLGEEFMRGGSHAGNYETSLMLAAAPGLVDETERAALPTLAVDLPARIKAGAKNFLEAGGPLAYFGAPADASAAEGERLFGILVDATLAALEP